MPLGERERERREIRESERKRKKGKKKTFFERARREEENLIARHPNNLYPFAASRAFTHTQKTNSFFFRCSRRRTKKNVKVESLEKSKRRERRGRE